MVGRKVGDPGRAARLGRLVVALALAALALTGDPRSCRADGPPAAATTTPGVAPGPEVNPGAAPPPASNQVTPATTPDPATPGFPDGRGPLQSLAARLPVLVFLLYAVLLGGAAVRSTRKEPLVALLALGLAGFSLALRFLAAPRVPMVGQTADLVHLNGALEWLAGTPTWAPGASAPAYTSLLCSVLAVVGVSFEAAFATTTVLGALLVLPAFATGRRLGGSVFAGWLAGLAAAVLPLGVIYSNGVNLEIPMAFFLAMALQHALAWIDEERPADALRLALALLVFAQLRQDAVLEVPAFLAGLLAMVIASGKARALLGSPGIWCAAAVAATLGLPFLLLTSGGIPPEHASEVHKALGLLAVVVPAVLLLGPIGRWMRPRLHERPEAWAVAAASLALLGGLRAAFVLSADGAVVLAPHWPATLALDPDWITAPVFTATYGSHRTTSLDNPWVFPLLWLVPAFVGLLMGRRSRASRAAPAAGLVLGALALFWWRIATTCMAKSGELIADGNRYLVPTSGLLALLVGVGAAHLLEFVPRVRWARIAGRAGLTALMLSPLATHHRVLTDVAFDQQQRYQFVRRTFANLPERSLVLTPDHLIYSESPGSPDGGVAWQSSRTPSLCKAFRGVFGEPEDCKGLREWAGAAPVTDRTLLVFLDLDCYRTRTGVEDPLCAQLRALPGLAPIGRERFSNRPYGRYPLSNIAEVEIALLRVPTHLVDQVRELTRRAQ